MNQDAYTKLFLRQANIEITEDIIKSKRYEWWTNTRTKRSGGLRLSDKGLAFVQDELNITTYTIPFPLGLDLLPQVYVFLDQFLDCPYHLNEKTITVLSERKHIELHLFSGDVRKYGLTKAMTRKKSLQFK